MNKILISVLMVFVTLAACKFATISDYTYKNHTFTAKVGYVRLQSRLIEQGKRNEENVSVEVPTVLFEPPIKISDVRTPSKSYGEEIDFFVKYTKTFIDGSKQDILSFWYPTDTKTIAPILSDEQSWKKIREYMSQNGLTIYGLVKHKDVISILHSSDPAHTISLKRDGNRYYLINAPDAVELELAIIEASFMK